MKTSTLLSLVLLFRPSTQLQVVPEKTRREWLHQSIAAASSSLILTTVPPALATTGTTAPFQTSAFGQQEYTNSITASRDTNLSPAEAYDVLKQRIPRGDTTKRALDLGAGAGLSTQVLYQAGYTNIDAVDWSKDAWDASVLQQPESVQFYELADQDFLDQKRKAEEDDPSSGYYNVIVYNFAINPEKAVAVAQQFLSKQDGLLLAPCNDRRDYWYKQSYLLLNAKGNVVWKSAPEVGAWSVQFQPDVTSPTCTGIWCGSFNGFDQKRSRLLQKSSSSSSS